MHDPNIELMLSLRPTLVAYMPADSRALAPLEKRGARLLALPSDSLAEISASILTLGRELSRERQAEALVASINEELETVKRKAADKPRLEVLFGVGHPPGILREIYTVGPGTFVDELMTIAGARNVMRDANTTYPIASREYLLAHVPDLVIDSKPDGDWTEAEENAMRAKWIEFLGPVARDKTRVVFIHDHHLTIPGPSVGRTAAKLHAMFHPGE